MNFSHFSFSHFNFAFDFVPAIALETPILWWHAIILGLVQGLTEFIPVSSSGHLNITHWLLGQDRELAFDVFIHIGTLFALAFYFRDDWKKILFDPASRQLRNLVFLACVPAVIVGVFLRKLEDRPPLSEVWFNATMLIVAGVLLLAADTWSKKERDIGTLSTKDALLIGCSQALALFPGVSRSGATLTAGLALGFSRADAARFSFLMSLPITLGAVLFEFYSAFKHGRLDTVNAPLGVIMLGIVVSAVSGFWAIGFLLNYLKRHSVLLFVIWRVLVALLVFALLYSGFRSS